MMKANVLIYQNVVSELWTRLLGRIVQLTATPKDLYTLVHEHQRIITISESGQITIIIQIAHMNKDDIISRN